MVHGFKYFPKVYKGINKRGVKFVQVAVYKIKEADKAVTYWRRIVCCLIVVNLWMFLCVNKPSQRQSVPIKAGDGCDDDWF